MNRLVSTALAAAVFALGGASTASAQALAAVEHSGRVFHVAVCPGPSAPGTARCHAHVVTARAGNPISQANPNAAPSGFGPSDLRSAYAVTGSGSKSPPV